MNSGRYRTRRVCNFCGEGILNRHDKLVNHAEECRPDKILTHHWWGHVRRMFYENPDTENADSDREGRHAD